MRARPTFVVGLFVGALGAALGLTLLPSLVAGEAGSVRLLVGCDEGTRPRVIEALRGLPVKVLDLGTMESVSLETSAPPTLRDARAVLLAVNSALESARKAAGQGVQIQLQGLSVRGPGSTVEVRVTEARWMDAVFEGLRGQTDLERGGVQRGPVVKTGSNEFVGRFDLVGPLGKLVFGQDLPEVGDGTLPAAAILAALERVHATLFSVSAEQRLQSSGIGRAISTTYRVDLAVGVGIDGVLEALNEIPGLRVTEVDWRVPRPGQPARVRIVLAGRVGR